MSQIIQFHKIAPNAAVDGLNRITGLDFDQYPESLLDQVEEDVEEIGDDDYPMPGEQHG